MLPPSWGLWGGSWLSCGCWETQCSRLKQPASGALLPEARLLAGAFSYRTCVPPRSVSQWEGHWSETLLDSLYRITAEQGNRQAHEVRCIAVSPA